MFFCAPGGPGAVGRRPAFSEGKSMDDKIALSIDEVVNRCGVSRTRIYEEIRIGRIRIKKVGRRTIIEVEEIKRWLEELPPVVTMRDAA